MSDKAIEPRSVALVGPYTSGKTTLLESMLFVSGAINRRGSVSEGNSAVSYTHLTLPTNREV